MRPYDRAERSVEDFVEEFRLAAMSTNLVPPSVRLWLVYLAGRVTRRSLVAEVTVRQEQQARELQVTTRSIRHYAKAATTANCITKMGGGYSGLDVIYRLNHPSKWRKTSEKAEENRKDETLPPFERERWKPVLPPLTTATTAQATENDGLTVQSPCQTCEGEGCSTCDGSGVECA